MTVITETSSHQIFQIEFFIMRNLVARIFFRTSVERCCIMSLVSTGSQCFLVSDANIFVRQDCIVYSYIRSSNDGIFLTFVHSIPFQRSLQSDHIRSVKSRLSCVGVQAKKLEVNSSCYRISFRFSNNFNQLACSNCASCFNHFCRTVNVAIVSICQLEACRVEVIAGSCQSSCREFIRSSGDTCIFTLAHRRILQGSESNSFNTVNEQIGSKRNACQTRYHQRMQTCQVLIDSCNLTVDFLDISLNIFDISFNNIQFVLYSIFQITDSCCIFRDQVFQTSFAATDFFPQSVEILLCGFDIILCSFDVIRINVYFGFQCDFHIFIQFFQRCSEVLVCRLQ